MNAIILTVSNSDGNGRSWYELQVTVPSRIVYAYALMAI